MNNQSRFFKKSKEIKAKSIKQRFSTRKLSVGMVSVLLGFTFIFGGSKIGTISPKLNLLNLDRAYAEEAEYSHRAFITSREDVVKTNEDDRVSGKPTSFRMNEINNATKVDVVQNGDNTQDWTLTFNYGPIQVGNTPNDYQANSWYGFLISDDLDVISDINFTLSFEGRTPGISTSSGSLKYGMSHAGDLAVSRQSVGGAAFGGSKGFYAGSIKDVKFLSDTTDPNVTNFLWHQAEFSKVYKRGIKYVQDMYDSAASPLKKGYKFQYATEGQQKNGVVTVKFKTRRNVGASSGKFSGVTALFKSYDHSTLTQAMNSYTLPPAPKVEGEIDVKGENANKPILLEKKNSTDIELIIPDRNFMTSSDKIEVYSVTDGGEKLVFDITNTTSSQPTIGKTYYEEDRNINKNFTIKKVENIGRNIKLTIGTENISSMERLGYNAFIQQVNNKPMYAKIVRSGQQISRGLYINDKFYVDNPEYTSDEYRNAEKNIYKVLAQSIYRESIKTNEVTDRIIVGKIDAPNEKEKELAKEKAKQFLNGKISNSVKEIQSSEDGTLTAIFIDGSKISNINPVSTKESAWTNREVNRSGKQRDFMIQRVEPVKLLKKGTEKLTAEEQNKIKTEVVKANPSLQQENVAVDENGKVTTKYADKVTEGPVFEASETVVRVKNPAVQVVENEKELSLREKEKIKDAIISANTDLGIDRLTIKSQ